MVDSVGGEVESSLRRIAPAERKVAGADEHEISGESAVDGNGGGIYGGRDGVVNAEAVVGGADGEMFGLRGQKHRVVRVVAVDHLVCVRVDHEIRPVSHGVGIGGHDAGCLVRNLEHRSRCDSGIRRLRRTCGEDYADADQSNNGAN